MLNFINEYFGVENAVVKRYNVKITIKKIHLQKIIKSPNTQRNKIQYNHNFSTYKV